MNRHEQQKEHERLMLERKALHRQQARAAANAAKPQPKNRTVETPAQADARKKQEHLDHLERKRAQRELDRPNNGMPKKEEIPALPLTDIEQLEQDVFTSDE